MLEKKQFVLTLLGKNDILQVIEKQCNAILHAGDNMEKQITDISNENKRKNYTIYDFPPELLNTPIYDDELMEQVLDGIVSNVMLEMDKQGLTTRGLAELSDGTYSHLSRIFNHEARIGLQTLIKVAYALHLSPAELFPYDINKRKTNGQRFDEITKELDVVSSNFLLGICADYVKEWRRISGKM